MLGACAGAYNVERAGTTHALGPWHRIYANELLVAFDPANTPEVIGARQRENPERERIQEAILANDTQVYGENKLIVAMRTKRDGLSSPAVIETGGDYKFLPETVEDNARSLFDGAIVDTSPVSGVNDRGAYYYVTARYLDQATCIYAWQVMNGRAGKIPADIETVALQFRYCADTDDTTRLVKIFDDATLVL